MTSGGPKNATLFYSLYIYQKAFEDFEMGYASALAWVLFLIITGFTYLAFRVLPKNDNQEANDWSVLLVDEDHSDDESAENGAVLRSH